MAPRSEREDSCQEPGCEQLAIAAGYCRLHYIKNWSTIKHKQEILKDGKFQRYVEELLGRRSEEQLRAIRQDLSSEESFARAILDIEQTLPPEEIEEGLEGLDSGSMMDSIEKDFDGTESEG